MKIRLIYLAVDGYRTAKTFTTLEGAQTYAWKMIGQFPSLGSGYAVSDDGVGTIRGVEGTTLKELFPGA